MAGIALIKRLQKTRAEEWDAMKAIMDVAEHEDRDMDAAEQESAEKATTSIGTLDERIDSLTDLEKRNVDFDAQRGQFEPGDPNPNDPVSVGDQFRSLAKGEVNSIELDLSHLSVEVDPLTGRRQYRDLTVGTSTEGGDTVPTSFTRRLYEHFVESSAIRRTNVTVVTTTTGENLDFPKTTGLHTATLVAEAGAILEDDPTFAKLTLGAFKFGVLTQVSFELLQDTAVDLEGFLAKDMGRAVADDMGTDFIVGDGSGKPNGVVTASTLGVTGGTGQSGVPTGDEIIDLQYSVIDRYASRATWMMRRATEGKLRKIKAGAGADENYLWQPGLQIGTPNQILGQPVVTDPNIAATAVDAVSMIFGDMSAYIIRDVGSIRVARSDDFAFSTDLATFKAVWRSDGDLLDVTGAIKHYVGGAS